MRVKIENVTEGSLEVRVSPTLSLSSVPSNADRDKYWAPVDLQRDGPLGIAKQPMGKKGDVLAIRAVPIKVSFDNKAQALEFSIDARHASWAKEISEVWPSRDLFATVNPGMYDLRLLLESDTGDCESGSVPVLIEKAGPGKSKP